MSEIKLLPCPFCGGRAALDELPMWPYGPPTLWVRCGTPRCSGTGPERKTKRGAISAWNRRHEEKTDDE